MLSFRFLRFAVLSGLFFAAGCASASRQNECFPECREGFLCRVGECIMECNPTCGAGERCTADRTCVPLLDGEVDASNADSANVDVGPGADAGPGEDAGPGFDGGPNFDGGPSADAGPGSDAGIGVCADGQAWCNGVCRDATMPDYGMRIVLDRMYGVDFSDEGDFAIDPCTGTMAVAFTEQVRNTENTEVYLALVPGELGATIPDPIRITTAPGTAKDLAIDWAGDRFAIVWSDPRHDTRPEECSSRCHLEQYYAAYDASGGVVVAETRLAVHDSEFRAHSTRLLAGPTGEELALVWGQVPERDIFAGILHRDGTLRDVQQISMTDETRSGTRPNVVWNGSEWTFLYSHDHPSGSTADRVHARTMATTGLLGIEQNLGISGEQLAFVSRGAMGYALIAAGGTPLTLYLLDLGFTTTTSLRITASTYDGGRGLAWDGDNLYVTHASIDLELIRFNAIGVETGRIQVGEGGNQGAAADLRLRRLGTRLFMGWQHPTTSGGSRVIYRLNVLEAASAM